MDTSWQERVIRSSISEQKMTPSDSISTIISHNVNGTDKKQTFVLNDTVRKMLMQGSITFLITLIILTIVRPPFVTKTKDGYNHIVWKTFIVFSLITGIIVAFFPRFCKL